MRIKNFTLMTLALLMMSVVTFAQKPAEKQRLVTPLQKALEFQRSDHLEKEDFSALEFNHNVLPQFAQKTKKVNVPASLKAKVNPVSKKSPKQVQLQTMAQERATSTVKADKLLSPSWGQGSFANRSIVKRTAPEGSVFYDDFESGDLSQWTLKTLNEGDGWIPGTPEAYSICNAKSGDYVASSWSWNSSSYDVDNWLITPKVALGGSVVFWTYTNAEYPDKYEVLLSTTGTETTDFTVTLRPMAADAGGAWQQYVLDLSAYAGQEGYVAIHHQDYDMNYLFIDDFAITAEPYVAPTPVTPPAGLETTQFTILAYTPNSNNELVPFERVLNVGVDGTDVYIQGIGYYMEEAWIKGTLNPDGTVTFATGQYYGEYSNYPMYFQVYDYTAQATLDNLTLSIASLLAGSWPEVLILDCGSPTGLDDLYTYYEVVQVVPGTEPDPLTPPAGIEDNLVEYRLEGDAYDSDGNPVEYSEPIFIGIDGTDVWVKGVCIDMPNTWIKGTVNGNTVTFPTGQHFATYDPYAGTPYEGYYIYKFFFAGYDYANDVQADVTMTLDNNTGIYTMTSPDFMMINSAWLLIDPNLFFTTLQFVPVPDVAATPAQPTITKATLEGTSYPNITVDIPLCDVDGNPILSEKLSYQYYYDVNKVVSPLTLYTSDYTKLTADMTEIPYNFTDQYDVYNYRLYLNQDFSTWNKIGIQSIYRGGGEEHRSEIFWFTLVPYPHEVTFVAANDVSIQNGKATVQVDGTKATVDADGKLIVHETSTVTLTAASGYKFVSVTATGATIELDRDGFVATFVMPEEDITVDYEMRELYNPIQFATTGEYTIQDGQATVTVNGDDVTGLVDETGKLIDVPTDANVTITAEPGFKLANVTASYVEKATGGGAGGELTVFDGTATNSYVPVYGFYADAYLKCETVMPASELTAMAGSTINAMKFYLASPAADAWTATFKVFMKEVSETTLGAYSGLEGATVVYEGTLDATGETMDIEFTTPYQYNGGNLLIGIYTIEKGNYKSAHFYGTEATGASVQGYSYSSLDAVNLTVRNFIPKTTFTCTAGAGGELTVYDETTTNSYVPVYGFYADAYLKCETVMPASELTAMAGSTINAMKFYLQTPAEAAWTSTFRVFLKEVSETTISAYSGEEGATVVYEGTLDATGETMDIEFTTPYQYKGGNLLIGVYGITKGNYKSAYFYGTEATGASVQGYSYSSLDAVSLNVRNFIPKTTFTYAGGGGGSSVIDLEVNLDTDGYSASFTAPNGNVTVNYELVRLGYSINVPADTYITYYTDKDITIYDEDVELLTVTGVSKTEATVTPLTVVAANTPMLIHNTSSADKTLWIVPTEETHDKPAADVVTVASEFKGTLTGQDFTDADMAAKDHYVCTGQSFMWVRNAGSIAANKCWLEVDKSTTQGAPSLVIGYGNGVSGDATGIDAVTKADAENAQWYDLNGRRLQGVPTQKGVYIVNGKKVVKK